MINVKATKNGIDRAYFSRDKVKKALKLLGIGKIQKVNGKIADYELAKFIMLKEVESPLANFEAEEFLEAVRAENKPIEKSGKPMREIRENLKR